jgi:peptidylprolyl isomerase
VVVAHYTAWTRDGKGFDSSVSRGRPATFPIAKLFPGLQEGLQMMTVGESRRFWIPGKMAFEGQKGRPQGMVVFDVELLEIKR